MAVEYLYLTTAHAVCVLSLTQIMWAWQCHLDMHFLYPHPHAQKFTSVACSSHAHENANLMTCMMLERTCMLHHHSHTIELE